MKKPIDFTSLSMPERRRFLQLLAGTLATPAISPALRFACNEMLMGTAYAQTMQDKSPPTYFLEINLRDQWDHGHFFVAPGLATATNLRKGETGDAAALFFTANELRLMANNIYLTADSMELAPHVDTIAMVDCCELTQGAIHGHEAANPLRSPGRSYNRRSGMLPMYNNDPVSNFPQGVEAFYSATPTPATLHNFLQKNTTSGLRNGYAFKGAGRSVHTTYHFAANLPNAELDRYRSPQALVNAFASSPTLPEIIPNAKDAAIFTALVQRLDQRYFAQNTSLSSTTISSHQATVNEAQQLLHRVNRKPFSLPLTNDERTFWLSGVPPQITDSPVCNLGEQMAYHTKILTNDIVRSMAIEYDRVDQHDTRPEELVRSEAQTISKSLARTISTLKAAGIYDKTLIAIYCVDGSRSPAANSYGDEGKNTIILAGGMIRGGYYGDIRIAGNQSNGHIYSYHTPDLRTGLPGAGVTDNSNRIPAANVYATVLRALGIGNDVRDSYADIRGAEPLQFLLRTV